MTFKPGDKVSFLDEKQTGTVIAVVSGHRLMVMNEDGFEVNVSADRVVPLSSGKEYTIDMRKIRDKDEVEIKVPRLEKDEVWEVDLHLHDLIDVGREMTDHEKLKKQLRYFERCMQLAIQHRIRKVIFIHGVGKGTLKQELAYAIRHYDRVTTYDAPFKRYGFGAMVVEFFG